MPPELFLVLVITTSVVLGLLIGTRLIGRKWRWSSPPLPANGYEDASAVVEARLQAWFTYFQTAVMERYVFGILGIACSTIAAITTGLHGDWGRWVPAAASLGSAMSISVIGFLRPEQEYQKFVRAWRILDVAFIRYKAKLIEMTALLSELERAEGVIGEFEIQHNNVERQRAEEIRKQNEEETKARTTSGAG